MTETLPPLRAAAPPPGQPAPVVLTRGQVDRTDRGPTFAVPRNEGAKPGGASPCRDLSDVLSAVERADLAGHCHAAQGWAELQGRFMLSGFVLRADPSGPVLCLHPGLSPIGALAALGVDPGALAARFGRGLPSRADLAAT